MSLEPNMQKPALSETQQPTTTVQAPRRGPVPLDPALLVHVAGGYDGEQAPHGRWSPIETTADYDASAPHGRW
jgi:hypothetical protein